ncbi:hypothetical protein COT20_01265 [bacterium (Candidatus Gribaldobacteria) CG08_land_8_20_14_0_20_39_15]|uniref:Type II/III secretion system secretin-like domain-containing protein n=1 Tax=bacterium (Candidatus Gribaldobacteria) CG08_land_8_20_14_0_20_39_15 TaxID=2014273 RepID=A0A2M6XUR1_9BACT|nr:MAG: hypothetical protein COT20_01265 [bacterium (Candidatus Gribaldobacteria) CG08_land_8_20_14_0_20_39_15]
MKRMYWRHWLLFVLIISTGCGASKQQFLPLKSTLPAIIKNIEPAETIEGQPEQPEEDLTNQPKVSNLWEETDLRTVLRDCSAQTGINIICDETVQGIASLELRDAPLERALKIVLFPWGLSFKKIDDYYFVGSGIPGTSGALLLSQTESIITNKPADDIANLLDPTLKSFVKSINHCIVIVAPRLVSERIKEQVRIIDSPQPLISIELVVTERRCNQGKKIGFDWSQALNFSLSGDWQAGSFAKILKTELNSSLQALVQQGNIELKANPKIVVQNGQVAEINLTKEKYIVLYEEPSKGDGRYFYYSRYEAKPIRSGVMLKVMPQVSREGEIILTLTVEVSDMDESSLDGKELPIVNKREVKTSLRIKSGDTVAIGGLYQEVSKEFKNGLPFLGRIPFFFGRKKAAREKTELVIFVSPVII